MLAPVLLSLVSLVEGESCPAPVDVEARVRAILHLAPDQQLSEGFAVERHEAGLYVALRGADSTLIGERTLPTAGSCDELAQAAAVVLAAWLSDVHPDFAGALPAPAPDDSPPAHQEAPPAPVSEAPPAVLATPRPVATTEPKPAAAKPVSRLRLVGALGAELSGDSMVPAAFVGVSYGAQRGFALSARALVTWPREEPLAPGHVTWSRWPVGLGPTLRLEPKDLSVAFSSGVSAAWLRLGGGAFDEVSEKSGLAWGAFTEAAVSSQGSPWGWLGALLLQVYPGKSTAYVSGIERQWDLPAWSASLLVGARIAP